MLPLDHELNDKLYVPLLLLTGTLCVRLLGNNINSPRFIGNINVALLNVFIFLFVVTHLFDVCYEIELVVVVHEFVDTTHHSPYY